MTASPDGSVWVGYKLGTLERYTEAGRLLWCSDQLKPGITSLMALGLELWVGTLDGRIRVLDGTCKALARNLQLVFVATLLFASWRTNYWVHGF